MIVDCETNVSYPIEWEDEYRTNRIVKVWLDEFPDVFDEKNGFFNKWGSAGSLETFNDYALMYLLRKDGIHSVYYYELAAIPFDPGNATGLKSRSQNEHRQRFRQGVIRQRMGDAKFEMLQRALRDAGITDFTGEPDLFCWHRETGEWFFAEAKGPRERYTKNQEKWFAIARQTIPDIEIRTYRLVRSES